jgi:hypothetical protein
MKRNRRYNKWGYACANGFVVLAEGLDMFRLGLLTLAGIRTRQAICPLRKELWLAGCLRVEPREMGSLWLRAWATFWGIILAEGLHDWGMRAVPLFMYWLVISVGLCRAGNGWGVECDGADCWSRRADCYPVGDKHTVEELVMRRF